MKILHTYCLNYNLGDYALGIGVKNLLRNYLPVTSIGETNIQGTVFNEYYINEVVNKKYDLLIVGGGGIIHGAHWPNGWFWIIEKKLIKTIKIPFIVYGVGFNYFEDEEGIPLIGIEHLKETFNEASYFSVRNDGSYDRLKKQTGINAHVIPDPGFHVGLNSEYERPLEQPYIVIQLANDKPEHRFKNTEIKDKFISETRAIIKDLSKKYLVVLAPHVIDDIEISKQVSEGIDNCIMWNFSYFAFDHADKSLAYYKYAEFVIAMRGHGQIVPISFNTPVISLENHPKHKGLMQNLNLLEYNVNIMDADYGSRLMKAIDNVEINHVNLVEQYEQINKKLLIDSSNAFCAIKTKISL